MSAAGQRPPATSTGKAAGEVARTSIWPHVEERVVDLVDGAPLDDRVRQLPAAGRAADGAAQRDPRANGWRRVELRGGGRAVRPGRAGDGPVRRRSRRAARSWPRRTTVRCPAEQRALIEDELKTGLLPAVVATSSLELGIDMGAVDLVIQVGSPPSVASGLQRIGRAGHQVGAPSHGHDVPEVPRRPDLGGRGRRSGCEIGAIESLAVIAQPAGHRRAADRRDLRDGSDHGRTSCSSCCAGRRRSPRWAAAPWNRCWTCCPGGIPSEQFAELRPRMTWDRVHRRAHRPAGCAAAGRHLRRHHPRPRAVRGVPGRRRGARGARRATGRRAGRGDGLRVPGRRRVRARFQLVAHRRHHPRPGAGAAGAGAARPAAVLEGRHPGPAGRARVARTASSSARSSADRGRSRDAALRAAGPGRVRAPATCSTISPSSSRRPGWCRTRRPWWWSGSATSWGTGGSCCTRRTARAVHAPWALVIAARMRERYGVDVAAMHADDGIVLRLPDVEYEDGRTPDFSEFVRARPADASRPR